MSGLPMSRPFHPAHLTRADLIEILDGLAPGEYRSADLLPRVNAWLANKDREPVTTKVIGQSLARTLDLTSRRVQGGVKAFRITPEAVAGRDWFKS